MFLECNKAAKPGMSEITPPPITAAMARWPSEKWVACTSGSSKPLAGTIMAHKHNILAKDLAVQLPLNAVKPESQQHITKSLSFIDDKSCYVVDNADLSSCAKAPTAQAAFDSAHQPIQAIAEPASSIQTLTRPTDGPPRVK